MLLGALVIGQSQNVDDENCERPRYTGDLNDRYSTKIRVAGLETFGLVGLGALVPAQSIYHQAPWSPVFAIVVGLPFGCAIALAGNFGFGAASLMFECCGSCILIV